MRLITIEEQICPICLDVLNPLTQKIELKCTHVYHKNVLINGYISIIPALCVEKGLELFLHIV